MAVTIHTIEDIVQICVACRPTSEVLNYIASFVVSGMATGKLGQLCHVYVHDVQGTVSTPLSYTSPGYPSFPASTYTLINDVICHGIPGGKVLKNGDIINLDIVVITKESYYGDTSRTFVIGEDSILAERLIQVTFEYMWKGITIVRPGIRLGDIGHVIQQHAEAAGYSVVREHCGHGIGKKFHEDPQILHYGWPGTGMELKTGMIFTIKPTIDAGKRDIRTMSDQ